MTWEMGQFGRSYINNKLCNNQFKVTWNWATVNKGNNKQKCKYYLSWFTRIWYVCQVCRLFTNLYCLRDVLRIDFVSSFRWIFCHFSYGLWQSHYDCFYCFRFHLSSLLKQLKVLAYKWNGSRRNFNIACQ